MPARMWRHGIHSFLELLRHRVPDLLDHMLAFVYLAYSMLTLEMESAPPLEETWIESLGNLARYSIAVAEADLRDREVWLRVSRMWYRMAVDQKLDTRSIPPPLAVLVRLDGELLESKQDLRRRNTSSNDNVDQHCSTPRVRVENIVTHPSASDENDANCTRAHSTEYFNLQAHQLEHFPASEDVAFVPEDLDDSDPGLESDNQTVSDQSLDLGETWPVPEDPLLKGQEPASHWHDPELGGDLYRFSGHSGSGQDALQSTIENPDGIGFNEWIGVDGYDDANLGLVIHSENALSPVLADIRPSNDDYLPGVCWSLDRAIIRCLSSSSPDWYRGEPAECHSRKSLERRERGVRHHA